MRKWKDENKKREEEMNDKHADALAAHTTKLNGENDE
jgi:hypothetical protein